MHHRVVFASRFWRPASLNCQFPIHAMYAFPASTSRHSKIRGSSVNICVPVIRPGLLHDVLIQAAGQLCQKVLATQQKQNQSWHQHPSTDPRCNIYIMQDCVQHCLPLDLLTKLVASLRSPEARADPADGLKHSLLCVVDCQEIRAVHTYTSKGQHRSL